MRVLALDQSKTCTGWALWAPGDDRAASGHFALGSEYTPRSRVFCRLHEELTGLQTVNGAIDALFYEQPLIMSEGSSAETLTLLWGIAAHIESWGEAMGCRIIRATHAATWRRHFIGKMPRAKTAELKDRALERCRQLGFRPKKHDEAEAIGILDFACDDLRLTPPWRDAALFGRAMVGAA